MLKNLIFSIVVLSLVSFTLSGACSDKAILSNYKLKYSDSADETRAFNGPASCATLSLDSGVACCYIKLKFKNEKADETFTHKGCYEISGSDFMTEDYDFDENIIKNIETNFDNAYANSDPKLVSKKISIDCSSKYLNLVGFALLFLLL